jgi:hypothetical protein
MYLCQRLLYKASQGDYPASRPALLTPLGLLLGINFDSKPALRLLSHKPAKNAISDRLFDNSCASCDQRSAWLARGPVRAQFAVRLVLQRFAVCNDLMAQAKRGNGRECLQSLWWGLND